MSTVQEHRNCGLSNPVFSTHTPVLPCSSTNKPTARIWRIEKKRLNKEDKVRAVYVCGGNVVSSVMYICLLQQYVHGPKQCTKITVRNWRIERLLTVIWVVRDFVAQIFKIFHLSFICFREREFKDIPITFTTHKTHSPTTETEIHSPILLHISSSFHSATAGVYFQNSPFTSFFLFLLDDVKSLFFIM